MNTDDLIIQLAGDARPVRRLPTPGMRMLVWLALAVPVVAFVVALHGWRPDLAVRMNQPRFVIELLAALATGLTAGWATFASTVPGAGGRRLALPLLPASIWLAALGEGCWREWLAFGNHLGHHAWHPQCMPEIAATSVIPIIALVAMARRGAALNPSMTAALAALAAASLAAAGMALYHPIDASVAVLIWQFGTVALLSALAGMMGRRLFA